MDRINAVNRVFYLKDILSVDFDIKVSVNAVNLRNRVVAYSSGQYE